MFVCATHTLIYTNSTKNMYLSRYVPCKKNLQYLHPVSQCSPLTLRHCYRVPLLVEEEHCLACFEAQRSGSNSGQNSKHVGKLCSRRLAEISVGGIGLLFTQ